MTDEKLLVKDKDIVVPGEVLAKGMSYLPGYGTFRDNDNVIANRLGLLTVDGKVLKTVPLAGRYLPKKNDTIIETGSSTIFKDGAVTARGTTKEETKENLMNIRDSIMKAWLCAGCGICVAKCPTKAIKLHDNSIIIDPDLCTRCYKCLQNCPILAYKGDPISDLPDQ